MKKSDEMKAKLDDLSTRVNVAREANNPKEARGLNEASTYGVATRLIAELVSVDLDSAEKIRNRVMDSQFENV